MVLSTQLILNGVKIASKSFDSMGLKAGFDASPPQKTLVVLVFRRFVKMEFAGAKNFDKLSTSRGHAAAVAVRDRDTQVIQCHSRALCPLNLKSLWLWLQLQSQLAHNKKSLSLFWTLSQNQHLLSTKFLAGRRSVAARAIPPQHSDLRGAL